MYLFWHIAFAILWIKAKERMKMRILKTVFLGFRKIFRRLISMH